MILVIGHHGQVARSLLASAADRGLKVHSLSRQDLDFHNFEKLGKYIVELNPQVLINAAAYTAVDKAESEEEKEECFFANALLPEFLAIQANLLKIPLVHFSTDYVFSGAEGAPWREDDSTDPLCFYGKSKLAGEKKVLSQGGQYLIFRTSWVYSSFGHNFLKTMLKLGAERESLKIVVDQIGAPTNSDDLAVAVLDCLEKAHMQIQSGHTFPTGIYHLAGRGETSWYGFAKYIFTLAREMEFPIVVQNVLPIPTVEYPTPATRPLNSRLNQDKIENVFSVRMPEWRDSLKACLLKLKESK